jgi:hypothetical protein
MKVHFNVSKLMASFYFFLMFQQTLNKMISKFIVLFLFIATSLSQIVFIQSYRVLDLNEFFWGVWGLNQGSILAKQALTKQVHTSSPLCSECFGDGLMQTICPC